MLHNDKVQFQLFHQTVFDTVPGTPSGIYVPRGPNFNAEWKRNKIANPAKFSDGRKRKFALGNHTTSLSGQCVPNLEFYPYLLQFLGFTITTTGAGPYVHTCVLGSTARLHLIEKGIVGAPLWSRYFNMVGNSLSWDIPIEGIFACEFGAVGSGNREKNVASLDATPTEVVGEYGEYANFTLLEDAADPEDIINLKMQLTRSVAEKRVSGKGGKASELLYGGSELTGTLSTYFESEARAAKAEAKTIEAIDATIVVGAASAQHILPEVQLEPGDWTPADDGGVIRDFNFESVTVSSADAPIKIVVTNSTATYPWP